MYVVTSLCPELRIYLPCTTHLRQCIPKYLWKVDRATPLGHGKLPRSFAPSAIPNPYKPLLLHYCHSTVPLSFTTPAAMNKVTGASQIKHPWNCTKFTAVLLQ